ncbi:hypothetical protein [Mycobacterium sp.]|uniref:hypothetical protein n=1 Tax=Mycobacterium sp. TaxID=1785 RepID=UPI003BA918C9
MPSSQIVVDQAGIDTVVGNLTRNLAESGDINGEIRQEAAAAQGTWHGSSGNAFQEAAMKLMQINEQIMEEARYGLQMFQKVTSEFMSTDQQIATQFMH